MSIVSVLVFVWNWSIEDKLICVKNNFALFHEKGLDYSEAERISAILVNIFFIESLTLCLQGNFSCFFRCQFFSNSTFLENSFRNTISLRVSNSLDLDQARCFVQSD